MLGTSPPALLNSMSTRPNFSPIAANSAATWAGSVTSVGTASVCPPVAMRAVSSSASLRRPASATDQPSFSSARADARPMPLPAPVMTATRSAMVQTPPRVGVAGPVWTLVARRPRWCEPAARRTGAWHASPRTGCITGMSTTRPKPRKRLRSAHDRHRRHRPRQCAGAAREESAGAEGPHTRGMGVRALGSTHPGSGSAFRLSGHHGCRARNRRSRGRGGHDTGTAQRAPADRRGGLRRRQARAVREAAGNHRDARRTTDRGGAACRTDAWASCCRCGSGPAACA